MNKEKIESAGGKELTGTKTHHIAVLGARQAAAAGLHTQPAAWGLTATTKSNMMTTMISLHNEQ